MSPFLVKNGYAIYRCPNCQLAQTDLRQDYYSFVTEYYAKGYFTGDPRYSAFVNYKDDKKIIQRNLKKFLAIIRCHKRGGRLLDVGCAMGFFVELAMRHGFDAYGFDASEYAVSHAKKINGGHRIQLGMIDKIAYPNQSFDIISLFDVFEHLANPLDDLHKLTKLLRDDGIMVIATGDTGSVAARLLKRRWTFYIPPQHLFFFNRDNLTQILGKAGLEPIAWSRIGKWLSLRYILHLGRTTGESSLAAWLYELIYGRKLSKLPLYVPLMDNMIVVVRKKKS